MATQNQIQRGRSLLNQAIKIVYNQSPMPTLLGKSVFPTNKEDIYPTWYINWGVRRFAERMANFTPVGSSGQIIQERKDTEKSITPPYMREGIQINNQDIYFTAIGTNDTASSAMTELVRDTAQRLARLKYAQLIRQEYMCWQALLYGKVTTDINVEDFGRSASSMIDVNTVSGKYWSDATADMYGDILRGCKYMREKGKMAGEDVIMFVGQNTALAMENNTAFKEKAKFVNMIFDTIDMPQRNAEGASPWGSLRVGSYRVYVFTYPQLFDVPDATLGYGSAMTQQYFIPDNMAVMVPRNSQNRFVHGAVPMLLSASTDQGVITPQLDQNTTIAAPFYVQEVYDPMNVGHYFYVSSRGIPILIAQDQVYTMQCLA
jgi:hypothetical protein